MWRLVLLIVAESTVALQSPGVGRRAVLHGVAASLPFTSSLATAPVHAYERYEANELEGVLDRAKKGMLSTDRVIMRAMNNQLVNPREIRDCGSLKPLYEIDIKAADEMRVTNDAIMKLNAASTFEEGSISSLLLGGRSTEALRESYEIGRLVEQRIRENAAQIKFKTARDCERRPVNLHQM